MKDITATCEIKEGRLHIIRETDFKKCIRTAPKGKYFLKLAKIYRKRSLNQNAYYHGVVVSLVRDGLIDVGYRLSNEQTHEFIKEQFLRTEITNEQTGEVKTINRSTTELTTTEFNEFIYDVIFWGLEYLSIEIPLPSEFEE